MANAQPHNIKTVGKYHQFHHANHLNKVLKEHTGNTTTDIISNRVAQEAKIFLKQTDWNISEIAYSPGFEEVAYFPTSSRSVHPWHPWHFAPDRRI